MNSFLDESHEIDFARPQERREALLLLVRSADPRQRQAQIDRILADLQRAEGIGSLMWVVRHRGRIAGAVHAQVHPGRSASLTIPQVVAGQPDAIRRQLLLTVVDHAQRSGVRLVQTLLEIDHGPDVELLSSAGFTHVTDLLYLVSSQKNFPDQPPVGPLAFWPVARDQFEHLAHLVERTHVGTLDCPQLNAVRTPSDVLVGYEGSGTFDPARWLIVRHAGDDVGCLLLTEHPGQQWEVLYLGLVPEARGRGWGITLTRYAQHLAQLGGAKRLLLAVDAENAPAIAMYAEAGFVAWDRRSVFLRIFPA